LFGALLGIPLLFSFAVLAEKRTWPRSKSLTTQGICVLFAGAYACSVPQDLSNAPGIHLFRFFLVALGLHLFASVGPFFRRGTVGGFWNYNMKLFLRILTTGVYAFVLWGGLAVALAALDHLFGISIPVRRYPELWILISGIFCTWFFLAGVPENLDALDSNDEYPKGLKVFAQYILVPIVTIYLVILYAYLAKIIVSWDWPQGWVSKLILGFSGTGMFSLLLLHPISGRTENVWIKSLSKWFYAVVAPLIPMLFLAVWRRVSQYGLTEGRSLALAMGVWLAVVVVYFILSRHKSIKFVPASLCVGVFLVCVGPWSVFSVAETSQVGRLRDLLVKDSVLVANRIERNHAAISFEDSKQVSAIIAYLHDMHGYGRIQPWFPEGLKQDSAAVGGPVREPAEVTKRMGIEYVARWQYGTSGYMFLNADRKAVVEIAGYDRMVRRLRLSPGQSNHHHIAPDLTIESDDKLDTITVVLGDDTGTADALHVGVREIIERALKDSAHADFDKIPPESLGITASVGSWKIKLLLSQIYIEREGEVVRPLWCDLDLFYSRRQSK